MSIRANTSKQTLKPEKAERRFSVIFSPRVASVQSRIVPNLAFLLKICQNLHKNSVKSKRA